MEDASLTQKPNDERPTSCKDFWEGIETISDLKTILDYASLTYPDKKMCVYLTPNNLVLGTHIWLSKTVILSTMRTYFNEFNYVLDRHENWTGHFTMGVTVYNFGVVVSIDSDFN